MTTRMDLDRQQRAAYNRMRKQVQPGAQVLVAPWVLNPEANLYHRDWLGRVVTLSYIEPRWDAIPFRVLSDEPVAHYDMRDPTVTDPTGYDTGIWCEAIALPLKPPVFTNATDAFLWLNEQNRKWS